MSEDSRLVTGEKRNEDFEQSIRPSALAEFVGQASARANLSVFIEAAKTRREALDHVLFVGPPGLGKTIGASIIFVDKASGANARTVAEVFGKRAELKDKVVVVRGKVVKYSPEIMGKNWLHLRDGSGSDADGNNDLLVTTSASSSLGAVVTVKGTVRLDKNFGAGYAYPVMIEEATLQP